MENEFDYLIGSRVATPYDTLGEDFSTGILIKIESKGRYPFIIQFDSGSCYGVSKIEEIK